MPPLNNIRIQHSEPHEDPQRHHISTDEGYIKAEVSDNGRRYEIRMYRAYQEGQGHGKELLRLAREHAKSIGATVITASNISSDESAGAMAAVFGHEHITGGIDPKKVTSLVALFPSVALEYPVQPQDPPLRDDVEFVTEPLAQSASPVRQYWLARQ